MSISKKLSNTTKLEVENSQMENRLRILREMMSAEKARRESEGGIHWQSGKSGPLQFSGTQPTTSNSRKLSQKKSVKVRILTDKNIRKQNSDQKPNVPQCGQCERTSALLNCVECIENYCQLCFTKMHQKGGLAKHHVKPILQKIKHLSPKKVPTPPAEAHSPKANPDSNGSSLLEGTYDEAGSAKSFQEALAEWRGVKASNTCTVKETSIEPSSEVATMTATTQANMTKAKRRLNVEFSDKNRVTYFEKLLLRKLKDSPAVPLQPNGHDTPLLETEEEVPAISQYNVFYDAEPMEFESADVQTDPFDDFDFCAAQVPSGVAIEEISPSNDEHLTSTGSGVAAPSMGSLTVTVADPSAAVVEDMKEKMCDSDGGSQKSVPKGVRLTKVKKHSHKKAGAGKKQEEPLSDKRNVEDRRQPDLSLSVKAAWASCTRSDHNNHQMANFFLHGVKPIEGGEQEEIAPEPPSTEDTSQFKLGSTVWLPSSSVEMEQEMAAIDEAPPLPPPTSSSSRPGTRDRYYDDDDTDSDSDDAEEERAAFISSRLSMVRDSIQGLEVRPGSSYRELEEEEEKMERDRADCECLDDLAWELASTVECEGRLTRCEGELDQLDLEERADHEGRDSATTPPLSRSPKEEWNVDVEEVDMSKVISEFELYQKELMEKDCDEQQ